jgi:broad specificity phosphatase PhoE
VPVLTGAAGCLFVMRHGERQDMADINWPSQAARPWDPPLSQFGHQQATQRGQAFFKASTRVDVVVSSPFTRCIETAIAFMRSYGLPAEQLQVDARVCEWMSARNLNLSHVDGQAEAMLENEVSQWFWRQPALAGVRAAVASAWSAAAAAQVRSVAGRLLFYMRHECQERVPSNPFWERWTSAAVWPVLESM